MSIVVSRDKKKTSPKDVAKRIAELKIKAKAKIKSSADGSGRKSASTAKKPKSPKSDWYPKAKERFAITPKS